MSASRKCRFDAQSYSSCINFILQVKSKLDNAFSQTSKPSKVADKCLRLRENRIGEDKVVDFVEESLVKELENVKMWQIRIKTALEQVQYQVQLLFIIFLYFYHRLSFKRRKTILI